MKIIQLVPGISFGDAVGNDMLAMKRVLDDMGIENEIYADFIDERLPAGTAKSAEQLPVLSKEDAVIYHMASGSRLNYVFGNLKCKRVMVYHNITPPAFFEHYDEYAYAQCRKGYEELQWLADKTDYCLAVSEYNKQDLIRMGFTCPIDVLPIVIPFEDYDKEPAGNILTEYRDGYTNILFVGRIVPNKKHEDIIRAFARYQEYYNPKSRLILIGSSREGDKYKNRLIRYIQQAEIKNVVFPGHISFKEILAFYKVADVFLCESEHEGFCVPLVEAMYLGTPIIAYDAAAVASTLNGAGILMDTKDPMITAGMIDKLVKDEELKRTVLDNQKERLADFTYEKIAAQFKELLQKQVI